MSNALFRATVLVGVAVLGAVFAPVRAQSPFHLQEATIDRIHAELKARNLSCRELITFYLRRIEAYDQAGPKLTAAQTVNRRALDEADRLDTMFREGRPVGPLHCIPVLLKDQVETSDMPTTYGSMVFRDFTPKRDATVVERLKAAGAIVIGKTTMGELAGGGCRLGLWRRAQSVRPRTKPFGVFRWERYWRGGELRRAGRRRGHGWIDSRSRRARQRRGAPADRAAGESLRHDACHALAGHTWSHCTDGTRCRADA